MGDPKFSRRKYDTPSHPWQKERIDAENELIRKYGLKNKTELWKTQSLLRQFRQRSRVLQAQIRYGNPQAEKEKEQLLKRLQKMGILGEEASLDDVLALEVEAVLTRRLQTLAYMKGLSSSQKQARQFIVHGHVSIGDRKVTIPGYLVMRKEEEFIDYLPRSPIANDMHPARPKDELDMATEPREEKKEDAPVEEVPIDEKPAEDKSEAKPKEEKAEKPSKDEKPEEKSKDVASDTPEESSPNKGDSEKPSPKEQASEKKQEKPPKEEAKDEPAPEKEKSKEEVKADEPPAKEEKSSKAPEESPPEKQAPEEKQEKTPEKSSPREKESKEEAKE